jgi:hypothetical protein
VDILQNAWCRIASRMSPMQLPPVFFLLLLCYVWPLDRDSGANVKAHIDAAAAVVIDHTFMIDRFVDQEPTATIDWSRGPDGHLYSSKAPGGALAAVPVFAALYVSERTLGVDPLSRKWFRLNCALVNCVLNALTSAFAMVLLMNLSVTLGLSRRAALVGTLAIALGTAYYPYATAYYAHNFAANLIIGAAWLIFAPGATPLKDAGAGLLAGLAVLFDYPAVFAVGVFAASLLVLRPHTLVAFAAGGLGPLTLYVWYHAAVFGSPFVTAYHFQNPRFAGDAGRFVTRFRPELLLTLTVSPFRGVLFYSPVLIAGLFGAGLMLSDRRTRAFAGAALLILAAWLLMNAAYQTWWGGRTTGPRFLVPATVLFGPFVGSAFERAPRLCLALLGISVANYVAITAVSYSVRATVANPLLDVIYPMFVRGEFERSNLGLIAGLHGLWSLAPLAIAAIAFAFSARSAAGERTR